MSTLSFTQHCPCGRATLCAAVATTSVLDKVGNKEGELLPPHPSPRQPLSESSAAKGEGESAAFTLLLPANWRL